MDQGPSSDASAGSSESQVEPDPAGPQTGRPDPRTDTFVLVLIAVSAVAAALSDARPTGLGAADVVWCALAALAVTWAAYRASAIPVALLGAVAAVVGVGGGWLPALCGLAALATGVFAASEKRPSRDLATLSGALAVQALLRGPSYGFIGLPTLVAVGAALPVLVSGLRRAPSGERRVARLASLVVVGFVVLASLAAGVAALIVRPHLRDAADQAQSALSTVRDGGLDEAAVTLDQATGSFASATSVLDGPLAWAGRAVPIVGQHVEALQRVSAAGEELTTTAGDAASSADYQRLKADNGSISISEVRRMAGPVRASADAVVDARAVVAEVRSPWLIGPVASELERFDSELADTEPAALNAADALEVAPVLLGGDRPQRYLLQFATPGESRAAGGFVGTYGLLDAADGHLSLGITGSTQQLGPEDVEPGVSPVTHPFVPPPGWDDLYGDFHVEYFPGNVSASPDWPTDSDVARQIYASVPGVGPTDGVLYADPTALAALLELTGPVDVPGIEDPLDAGNVEQYLYEGQYVQFASDLGQRRDVLGEVARTVFEALTSRPLPPIGELTDALGPVVSSGHLKFVSFDDKAEALFVRTGLAGAWRTDPGADWLSLRSTNLLPNKINWFLRRTMDVETVRDPATGDLESTVTVTLRNLAPGSGLPPYLTGNQDGFPEGTNHDGIALYTPHGLESLTVDGVDTGAQAKKGYGGNIYTVPVVIPPEGQVTVVYHLRGSVPTGPDYLLDVLNQPLAHDDDLTVTLRNTGSQDASPIYAGPLSRNVRLIAIGR